MTYNPQGKRITSENLAGQVTTTAWNQYVCNPVDGLISGAKLGGPGSVPAAGDTTTWLYDDGGWMIAFSRLCGRHRKPNSFLALLHDAADGEGHDRKNRSGPPAGLAELFVRRFQKRLLPQVTIRRKEPFRLSA